MRSTIVILISLFIISCSKDEFDPENPKNGQTTDLFVDHYRDVESSRVFVDDGQNTWATNLMNFDARKSGYEYKVRAVVIMAPEGIQDAPSYSFKYIKTLSEKKYQSTEPFVLPLVAYPLFGSYFGMSKENDRFIYMHEYQLLPSGEQVKADLEDALKEAIKAQEEKFFNYKYKQVEAIVTHDPDNWTKGYIVHEVRFIPK